MTHPDEWDQEGLRRLDNLIGTDQQVVLGDRAWRIARRRRRNRRIIAAVVAVVSVAVIVWAVTR